MENLTAYPSSDVVDCGFCKMSYYHLFKFDRSLDINEQLALQYSSLKPKIDYLAEKFIDRLSQDLPITFVRFGYQPPENWAKFFLLINKLSPGNQHRVINFDMASEMPSELIGNKKLKYISVHSDAAKHIGNIFSFSEFLKDNLVREIQDGLLS